MSATAESELASASIVVEVVKEIEKIPFHDNEIIRFALLIMGIYDTLNKHIENINKSIPRDGLDMLFYTAWTEQTHRRVIRRYLPQVNECEFVHKSAARREAMGQCININCLGLCKKDMCTMAIAMKQNTQDFKLLKSRIGFFTFLNIIKIHSIDFSDLVGPHADSRADSQFNPHTDSQFNPQFNPHADATISKALNKPGVQSWLLKKLIEKNNYHKSFLASFMG